MQPERTPPVPSTSRDRRLSAPPSSLDQPNLTHHDDDAKPKMACLACRSVKMRCLPQEPSGQKCARCDRLNQECVWAAPQKRGRKPKGHRCAPFDTVHEITAEPLECAQTIGANRLVLLLVRLRLVERPHHLCAALLLGRAESTRPPSSERTAAPTRERPAAPARALRAAHLAPTNVSPDGSPPSDVPRPPAAAVALGTHVRASVAQHPE